MTTNAHKSVKYGGATKTPQRRGIAQRLENRILRTYVRLCPFAVQINLTSPGIPALAILALLPR